MRLQTYLASWRSESFPWAAAGAVLLLAAGLHYFIFVVGERVAVRKKNGLYLLLVKHEKNPSRLAVILLVLLASIPWLPLPAEWVSRLSHGTGLLLIASVSWILIALLDVFQDYVEQR